MCFKPSLKSNLKLLQVFGFLTNFTFFAAITLIYFVRVTGSYALGISVFSIIYVAKALFDVPTGVYSDALGRKACLIIGAIFGCLSVVFYAIGYTYVFLAIGAVLEGAKLAFFSGNNEALLYESLADTRQANKYHDALGKMRSTPEAAWMVGGILGGFMAQWSFPLLMWLSVIPQILAIGVSFLLIEPSRRGKVVSIGAHLRDAWHLFVSNVQLRRLSVAEIIGESVGSSSWQLVPSFYNSLLPVWAVGLLVSQNFLASAVGFRLSGRVLRRFKPIRLLIFDGIYGRIVRVFAYAYPTMASPFLIALSSIFYGPVVVASNTLMQQEFTDTQRATMASLNSLFGGLLFGVCAILLGRLADTYGIAKVLLMTQFLTIPCVWLYIQIARSAKNRILGS